ncbi:biotin--[acetyl-CoA-carboxylase] ligase [Hazenella coriacea]|uniref:Bifunctional ligase/repressor BirA n=1 Tax=Hazenella coriacea TaxID=1179467 RepID=A0A4R3L1C5_9BACL|nr:biotin--[acetyl-CoA-carboxylase] ligase [Hazenella coriacea]TCS93363.1 BirA family biotin operon repressor/biotin-[acetyl-CoA-carboxylase] ligase [Hazenella coriacea]
MRKGIRNELIAVLLQNQTQFLSGEEISQKVGVSRTAIWKHIEELRNEGYEIEAKPRSGYRLVYRPDRVAPEEIIPHLHTQQFGKEIRYEFQTTSTQIAAHQWAKEGAKEGALVVAEEQRSGRGRLGRSWHSPPHTGIWMSLILRPKIPLAHAPHMTLLASIGVSKGIQRVTGLPIQIKWPNDLLINGKKVCGILCELRGEQDRIHYLVTGIGINVNTMETDLPPELKPIATSLAMELGSSVHRASLIAVILEELELIYTQYLAEGFSVVRTEWEKAAGMLGQMIKARTTQGELSGKALSLNENGALLLQTEQGVVPIYSAEIEW